jgi:hypothetical protein
VDPDCHSLALFFLPRFPPLRRNLLARRAGAPGGTGLPRCTDVGAHAHCPPPKGEIPFFPLHRTTNPSQESLDGCHASRDTDDENHRRLTPSGLPVSPAAGYKFPRGRTLSTFLGRRRRVFLPPHIAPLLLALCATPLLFALRRTMGKPPHTRVVVPRCDALSSCPHRPREAEAAADPKSCLRHRRHTYSPPSPLLAAVHEGSWTPTP